MGSEAPRTAAPSDVEVVVALSGVRTRVVALGLGGVLLTGALLTGVSQVTTADFAATAEKDAEASAAAAIDRMAQGLYSVVETQGESVQQAVDTNLRTATYVAAQQGGLAPGSGSLTWKAVNQLTKQASTVVLPRMEVGGRWLGQNTDPEVRTPYVDDAVDLVAGTVTVFQRTPSGDMLRVGTNVVSAEGKRAIGTYIPAMRPDGTPNPVIETVAAGKTYRGTALVVDKWYVTAYQPVKDAGGRVVGMLYVGVPQQGISTLREALLGEKVGENGSVTVLGATAERRGQVLLSADAAAEGSSMLEIEDSRGRRWVEQAVDRARELPAGELATVRYDDAETGSHTVRLAYFAPWDWVVAVVSRDADFAGAVERVQEGRRSAATAMAVAAVLVAVAGGLLSWWVARGVTAPLSRMRDRMAAIAHGDGDLTQRVEEQGSDEVAELGRAFNRFVDKIADTVRAITGSVGSLADTTSRIDGLAAELTASSEAARREVRAAGSAAREISAAVQGASAGAEQMGASIREISESASGAVRVADDAVQASAAAQATVAALADSSTEIGSVVKLITAVAEQTNLLALNATIEAARAGDAGKGFAVVAGEVKELASETARASADITRRVEAIQADSVAAAEAIRSIDEVIRRISDYQSSIAGAVEEQTATTAEMGRSVDVAAEGAGGIAASIEVVAHSSARTADGVVQAQRAVVELTSVAAELTHRVGQFRV